MHEQPDAGAAGFADAAPSPPRQEDAPPPRCMLSVIEERAGVVAACLRGTLDAPAVPPIRDALLDLVHRLRERPALLIVDLTGVSSLDGQGARLLAALSRRAYTRGQDLHLRAPARHLRVIIGAACTRPFLRA